MQSAARQRRIERCLSHVRPAPRGRRRACGHAARRSAPRASRPATSTTSICMAPARRATTRRSARGRRPVRRSDALQLHQGRHRPHARCRRRARGGHLRAGAAARTDARGVNTRDAGSGAARSSYLTENRRAPLRTRAQQLLWFRRRQLRAAVLRHAAPPERVAAQRRGRRRRRARPRPARLAGDAPRARRRERPTGRARPCCRRRSAAARRTAPHRPRRASWRSRSELEAVERSPGAIRAAAERLQLLRRRRRELSRDLPGARRRRAAALPDPLSQLGAQRGRRLLEHRQRLHASVDRAVRP